MTQARILIVEDDPDTARILEYWLRAHRYQYIGTAASGHEAIALANSGKPDLVLMDIVLPGELDGIETAGILLERFDIPVLYLTAFTDEALFERARTTSPAAYLTKPFNDRELGRAVDVALDRHALLRRLKASEAHLAEAQAVAHIGSWRWDMLRDQVVASDEMLRLFNLPPDTSEPHFDCFLQRINSKDRPRVLQAIERLLHTDTPTDIDVDISLENGSPRILRLRGVAHFDSEGKACELVGTARDVTNEWLAQQEADTLRKQLEAQVTQRTTGLDATNARLQTEIADHKKTENNLWHSEARYRGLVENLPDAVFVLQDDRVIFANPAAVRLSGTQSETDFLGKAVTDLVHPDTRQLFEQRKQTALTHREPNPLIAYSLMRSDGSVVEVESVSFAFDYDGRPAFLAVVRDLTERRRIEGVAERFRVALDSSPDAIFLIDPVSMRFVDANETACASLGYTHEELLARGPHDIKPHFNKTTLGERFEQVLAGSADAGIIQTLHQHKDGSTFPVEISLRPFESGGRQLMVVIARDITARQFVEMQLREANERFQQLAESVNEVFWIRDLEEDRFLYVSPAFETLFRKPVSSLYRNSRSFLSAVHPDDLERVTSAFVWQHQHRQGVELEYRIIVGDNVIRWLWVRTFPILDGQGKVYRMAGIAEDMTRRREYDEQYRAMIQTSLDSFLLMNAQGRLVDCNDAYSRAVGYTREELLQLSITDLEHNESPEQTAEHIRQVIEHGQDRFETRHRHKNGQLIDMEVSIHYRPDSRGGRLFAFLRDISQRKQAEVALIESEANLERAQSIAHIGSWKLDLRTSQLDWSAETHRIFGVAVGTPLTLEGFLNCVHPDDREAVGTAWEVAIGGAPYDIEHRIQVGDTIKWVREQAEIRLNTEGQPIIGFGSVQDVTETKQAELALRRSEARSRSILRAAPVGIGVLVQRVFQEVNEAMTRMTGYRAEELIGQSSRMLYPTQADFELVGTDKYQQIREFGYGSVETRWRCKDGRIIDIALSSSPIVANDLVQGITFTAQDITTTKQAEQARLTHESSQRDALVREVHHRIKNNLQGVIGLLRQHITGNPDIQPVLEAAIAQVNTIAVIHGLQSRLPQQELRLRELLLEVSNAAAAMALVTHPPAIKDTQSGDVWLDSGATVTIALILNELVHNAFKHGRHADGTGVAIALSGDDRLTTVHISNPGDSWPGNLDLTTGKGCGTGLDLIRTLLPRHGAQLNLYGDGTMLYVELVLSTPVIHASGRAG